MINLSALKSLTRARRYQPNSMIASDSNNIVLYIVIKGEVGLFLNFRKPNQEMIATAGPGDFFGEAALFLEKSKPACAVALTDVIALPLTKTNIVSFIKDEPETAFELMKALCSRMENVSAAYEKISGSPWIEPPSPQKEAPQPAKREEELSPAPANATAPATVSPTPKVTAPVFPTVTLQVPAPAAAPAPAESVPAAPEPSQSFSLFPQGHGSYQLSIHNDDTVRLFEKSFACPICKNNFKAFKIRPSKLAIIGTDEDMRTHYEGIEPMYYDVVTCPSCLYSALEEMFSSPDKPRAVLTPELLALRSEITLKFGLDVNTSSVFAGYYLALLCAPIFFLSPSMATAKLLLKLSRIYQDCEDQQMEEQTAHKALDAYLYVYSNEHIPPDQDQQLCIIIAELFYKLHDYKNAKDYYYKSRAKRSGYPRLAELAENRIQDIRQWEKENPNVQG